MSWKNMVGTSSPAPPASLNLKGQKQLSFALTSSARNQTLSGSSETQSPRTKPRMSMIFVRMSSLCETLTVQLLILIDASEKRLQLWHSFSLELLCLFSSCSMHRSHRLL